MLCLRTFYASLKSILLHGFCIGVLIAFQISTTHDVVSTKTWRRAFLTIGALYFLFFLLTLSHSLDYGDNCCMQMGSALIHVKHYRYDIIASVGLTEPIDVILAPFIKSAFLLYLHHILMGTCQKNTDGSNLIIGNLTFQTSSIETVLNSLCAIRHTFRELYQFTVQVCSRWIGILGMDGSFNVCRHSAVSTFGFV